LLFICYFLWVHLRERVSVSRRFPFWRRDNQQDNGVNKKDDDAGTKKHKKSKMDKKVEKDKKAKERDKKGENGEKGKEKEGEEVLQQAATCEGNEAQKAETSGKGQDLDHDSTGKGRFRFWHRAKKHKKLDVEMGECIVVGEDGKGKAE
jgi:hypothetical protein